jgi:hypothetical protein
VNISKPESGGHLKQELFYLTVPQVLATSSYLMLNNTCIYLRVRDSYIYMYRRRRIYKESSEEIQ